MSTPYPAPLQVDQPSENMVTVTHLVYALHAFAVFSAVVGSATIIFSFIASLPSIAAVVLNYWNQSAVRGTWLESHFRWQIRTFWFALLWVVVSIALLITVIGAIVGVILLVGASVWVIYRVVRGWWVLLHGRTLPMPTVS